MIHKHSTLGWGVSDESGSEIWDAKPVFAHDRASLSDRLKLLFYPKKFFLYRHIAKARRRAGVNLQKPFRVLDVGCGTGAALVDLKRLFGRSVDVVGIEVVRMEVDIARERLVQNGVVGEIEWFEGTHIPFPDASFDAVYSSDVLGHVQNVPAWLSEMHRVTKPGGVLAMFAESKLGRHAWMRNYLYKRGLNIDPHAEFHISLYSKATLQELLERSGFHIQTMMSAFWASFLVHPDEFYEKLQAQKKFPILRAVNKMLFIIKKKTHPFSTAAAELYGLLEMMLVGRWIEAQGYIILAKKK